MHRRPAVLLALLALLFLPGSASAQDSLTLKALARIEQYERLEPGLEEGDAKTAALYLNQIAWAKKRLDAVSDQSEATWQDANRRYLALREKIEKKARGNAPPVTGDYDYAKLVQLNKEIANALSNFQLLSPKHLLDASRVRGIERDFLDFDSRLAEFPAEDENVKIVAGNLAGFHRLFDASMEKVRAGRDAKGGMDAKLEELRAKYESKNTPGNLVPPFEEQQLRAWALEMKRWREREIPADLAFLSEAANNPAVNQQAVNSLYHWLSGTWKRRLDEVEKQVRERVASDVQIGQEVAQFILDTDPANRSHVLRILSKGRFDENMQRLQDARHAVAMARVYDDAMGSPAVFGPTITDPSAPRPPKPDREAQAQLVERAIVHLEAVVEQAL
ncbi:MAG TPA: hypothetical protein ENJ09_10210, partial [Planctomycetes bacterium]|nr:hypothetical protein [Planctomycetota bacterium]